MHHELPRNSPISGVHYFLRGLRLVFHPQLRLFVLVPLAINIALFIILTTLLVQYFDELTNWQIPLPEILQFLEKTLKWVAWFLIVVVVLIGYGYSFNIITNILAAPFYGLLAQKTEELVTGQKLPDESLLLMILRTVVREIRKLVYFLTRGLFIFLVMLLLGLTFFLNFLVPIVGTLWSAWSMSIQYVDYAADNHKTDFGLLRRILRKRRYSSVSFGGVVLGCSMIPVLNIIAMPAAVIGGTLFWVNEVKGLQVTRPPAENKK
ncbi:sulfate transporter CysZ [Saccharophagus sp. K07]|jgi:CysZ protein|uniref:sulfate transporter CysZ n=1 Tax=Saccharophagus sp. K07 TaxID=2283636 RepID=UPI001652B52D|nr:sulfate transporter CysZ [Saccharophagus sp. K07]MBC6907277.1 sulfate transporter CysZ [Saccharophagus sp. K07]